MPSPSRSNSSARSNVKKAKVRKNSSNQGSSPKRQASPSKKQRKNSSCSRSNKSVKSVQNTTTKPATNGDNTQKKKRAVCNSSMGSRSRSTSPPAATTKQKAKNSSQGSVQAPKRPRVCRSSASNRSKSPQIRQKVKKNSSDKSNASKGSIKGSPPRNGYNGGGGYGGGGDRFGNRDDGGEFRGRGRGRGRGGDRGGRGGGRGGFGGGDRGFNNSRDNGNGGGYNNGYGNNNNRGGDSNGYGNNNNNDWGNRDNNNNNNFNRDRDNNNNGNTNNYNNRDNNFNRNNNYNNYSNNRPSTSPPSHNNNASSPPFNRSQSPARSPLKIIEQPPIKKTPHQLRLQEFYTTHKEQGWFKEKYNPISLISQENERFLYIKKAQEEFLGQLKQGFYEEIDLGIEEYKSLGNLEFEENQDGELDDKRMTSVVMLYLNQKVKIQGPPLYGIEKDSATVYIPNVPKEIYRYDLYNVVSEHEGFKNLILNEPSRRQDWKRMGWVEFDDEQKAAQALEKLKDVEIAGKKIEFTKACQRIKKARIVTNYPQSRVEEDLTNAIEVASKLDYQAKIYENNPIYAHKFKSLRQKLQVFLTYLRKVHFYDYFQSRFYDSFRTLTIKAGMTVLLVQPPKGVEIETEELKKLDTKTAVVKEKGSTQHRQRQVDNMAIFNEILQKSLYSIHEFNPTTQQPPKYWKCHQCRKKFITILHLVKHMISRHEDLIAEDIETAQMKIYLKNEEEYEKTRAERQARDDKEEKRRRARKPNLKDFDCPEEEEDEEIRRRLRPVSNAKKLINFMDI